MKTTEVNYVENYENYEKVKVTCFNSIFDTNNPHTLLLEKVLGSIKNGNLKIINSDNTVMDITLKIRDPKNKETDEALEDKRKKELKSLLPIVCFNGIFETRRIADLVSSSGLLIVDYDEERGTNKTTKIKKIFEKDEYTLSVFLSPSGGLKVLVKIPSVNNNKEFLARYKSLEMYYKKEYDISIDTSGKDISRACYASYDKDIFINYNSEIYPGQLEIVEEKEQTKDVFNIITNQNVPTQCNLIEQFYVNNLVMSDDSKGFTKHTYVDPHVYNYCYTNKKSDLLKKYMIVHQRPLGAFNNSESMSFNCSALRKVKNVLNILDREGKKICDDGDKILTKHCGGCSEFSQFYDNSEDIKDKNFSPESDSDTLSNDKYKEFLNLLIHCKDVIVWEEKINDIAKWKTEGGSKRTVPNIKSNFKAMLSEYLKNLNRLSSKLRVLHNDTGIYFQKYISSDKNFGYYDTFAAFSELEKLNRDDYEVSDNTKDKRKVVHAVSALTGIFSEASKETEYNKLLNDCRYTKNILQPEDVLNFSEYLKKINEDNIREEKRVSIYCYRGGVYYSPKEYKCFNLIMKEIDGQIFKKYIPGNLAQDYIDFLDLNVTDKKLEKIINTLNKVAVGNEAYIWKGMFSKSLVNFLAPELWRLKESFLPMDVVIGVAGGGKSSITSIAFRHLWNSAERSLGEMGGVPGARIQYPNDSRPVCYEEVTEISAGWIPFFKEGATRGGVKVIKKGIYSNHGGGNTIKKINQNFIIDTNNFSISDNAMEERIMFWEKKEKIKNMDTLSDINYLKENVKYLGKYFYSSFINLDIEKMYIDAHKFIENLKISKDIRIIKTLAQIRLGETIIQKVVPNLFKHIKINYLTLLSNRVGLAFDSKDFMVNKIKSIINSIKIHTEDGDLTISPILNKEYDNNLAVSGKILDSLYDTYGLVISSTGNRLQITQNFLTLLNKYKERGETHFKSLNQINDLLKNNSPPKATRVLWIKQGNLVDRTLTTVDIQDVIKDKSEIISTTIQKRLKSVNEDFGKVMEI